jgi:hypothetical protein
MSLIGWALLTKTIESIFGEKKKEYIPEPPRRKDPCAEQYDGSSNSKKNDTVSGVYDKYNRFE